MKKNIGNLDRYLRLGLGVFAIILAIYFKNIFIAIIGIFAIFEALYGWCVLYKLLGRNTCPVKRKKFLGIF